MSSSRFAKSLILLLIGSLSLSLWLVAQEKSPERKPRKVALLVGPKTYLHDFKELPYLDKDVEELGKELKEGGFDEVVVLTGDHKDKNPATKANIMAELKRLLNGNTDKSKNIQKGDIVLLAFSGHGQEVFQGDKKSTYFAPIDGKRGDVSTLVNMSEVMELLAGCGSKNLVLADMCREIYNPNKGKGIDTDNLTIPKNSAILFGCESTQESFVNEELKHSLFSYAILEVLRDNRKSGEAVSWSGLVHGVEKKFESEQFKKLMEKGKKQSPVQRASDLGRTPLIVFATVKEIEFEYVIEGDKKKGKCEVMELELGDGVKMELVKIKKGKFMMGSPKDEKGHDTVEDEKEVEIKQDFWMGRYEVTQSQYKTIIGENPSRFKGENHPVESVSWDDATKFCENLSVKLKKKLTLPSQAQWEYACRAGTKTPFHFGSVLNGALANCNGKYPYGTETKGKYLERTTDVGSYPANPWGLSDMHGNVWEWCVDWLDSKQKAKIFRGGSWGHEPILCRSARCFSFGEPSNSSYDIGFRVICAVE